MDVLSVSISDQDCSSFNTAKRLRRNENLIEKVNFLWAFIKKNELGKVALVLITSGYLQFS